MARDDYRQYAPQARPARGFAFFARIVLPLILAIVLIVIAVVARRRARGLNDADDVRTDESARVS